MEDDKLEQESLRDMMEEGLFDFLFKRRLGARTGNIEKIISNLEIGRRYMDRYAENYPILTRRIKKNMAYMMADLGRLKIMIEQGEVERETRYDDEQENFQKRKR